MSDPVTNADIQDVLAQVRRLVLQATPPDASRASGPPTPADRTRLVLTPALRVGEGDGPQAEAPPGSPSPDGTGLTGPEPVLPPSDPFAGKNRRADEAKGIEAALGPGAWEPDGSEALDWMLAGLDERLGGPAAPILPRRAATPPQAEPARAPAVRPAASPQPSPAGLDEEVLRALVVEVVRAELQGELGERITRNLRKLVRSEVFRALESRQEP